MPRSLPGPSLRQRWLFAVAGSVALTSAIELGGCATYREDLNRSQAHYQANEYEKALALLRVLEADVDSLDPADQVRYFYVRGMTDYRLSIRADARHWLALARTMEGNTPASLQDDWKARMSEALTDLNKDYYGGSDSAPSGSASAAAPASSAIPGSLFKK